MCHRDIAEVSVLIACRSGPDMLEGNSGQSPTAAQVVIQGPNPETSPVVQQAPCNKQIYHCGVIKGISKAPQLIGYSKE